MPSYCPNPTDNDATVLTPEGGHLVYMKNGTGSASVKGTLVSPSTTEDFAFVLQANEYDTIGVVYTGGIANGQLVPLVISGFADVLLKDNTAATHGNLLIAADTDGRANCTVSNPGSGLPATDTHFKECGHCLESVTAGTNKLARCILHFN